MPGRGLQDGGCQITQVHFCDSLHEVSDKLRNDNLIASPRAGFVFNRQFLAANLDSVSCQELETPGLMTKMVVAICCYPDENENENGLSLFAAKEENPVSVWCCR